MSSKLKVFFPPLGLAVLVLSGAVGCGGGELTCGAGHDGVPQIIEDDSDMDTFWVASLGVEEVQVVGAGAEHDTLVQAHFSDFSEYRVQLAERLEFVDYPACVVYISQQVASGDRIPLKVERVTFGGLAGGEVVLEPNEFDHLPTDNRPGRGFEAETVSIEVLSENGESDFPAFSEQIAAPAQPVVTGLDDMEPVDLAAAPSIGIDVNRVEDMKVRWEPAGSDYVEVKIIPGAGASAPYGKMRCITFDDGCLEVPAAALAHLALDEATNFRFRIEHHNFVLHSIKEDGQTKAAALIDTSSSIEAIVLR